MQKNKFKKALLLSIISCTAIVMFANDSKSKTVNIFSKSNIRWMNKSNIKSEKYGFVPSSSKNCAEMWFKMTPGKKSHYVCSFKPFSVKAYDFLEITYKTFPGTCLVIDSWWDKGKMKRLARSVTSKEWKTIFVPIRGKQIKLNFAVKDMAKDNKGGIAKVQFRPLILRKGAKTALYLYKLQNPVLIPTPKQIQDLKQSIVLVKNGKSNFSIQLNNKEPELKKIIAGEIVKECGAGQSNKPKTVFSLNIENESVSAKTVKLPAKKESYVIKFIPGNPNIILLVGRDKAGLYWAWQTLRQLISKHAKTVKLKVCDVKDWPDFPFRSFMAYDVKTMKQHMAVKINTAMSANWLLKGYYWKPDSHGFKKYFNYLKALCNYALPRGCDILNVLGVHNQKGSISASDNKQIERLFKLYDKTLKLGNRRVVLAIDDGGRKKESFTPKDRKAYNNDVLLSHAWFIKKMSKIIWKNYPDALIIGTSKDYESTKGITGYYDRVGISSRLIMNWTGRQAVTFDFPEYAVKKYEKDIGGRRFDIADNTCTQAHGMYRGLTICEKYGSGYKALYTPKCIGLKAAIDMSNEVRKIRCMSIAEFMWNASRYNPELARQKAIAKVAGNLKAVKPILQFSREYIKLAYKYPIDKRIRPKQDFVLAKGIRPVIGIEELKKREISKYSIDDQEYNKICDTISLMKDFLKKIELESRNAMLNSEFKLFYRNAKEIIEYLRKNSVPVPTILSEKTFTFNINNIPGGTGYKKRGLKKLMSAAIYGRQTANNTFNIVFKLKTAPAKNTCYLQLTGWDCDKNMPPMVIKINGKKVFSGKTTFGYTYPYKTGPGKMAVSFSSKYLIKGKNTINIINDATSSDLIDNWIVLTGVALKF